MNLRTERLLLREFVEGDWLPVLAYQSDPRYLRFYPWAGRTEEDARAFVGMFIDWQREERRVKFQLAIVLAEGGRLIGNCGVRKGCIEDRQAELGYELDPAYWGHGYATEAARAMLAFGFDDLRLHRIWGACVAGNAASAGVMEKLGMRLEGRLRESDWIEGRWYDSLVYGILEQEWRQDGAEEGSL